MKGQIIGITEGFAQPSEGFAPAACFTGGAITFLVGCAVIAVGAHFLGILTIIFSNALIFFPYLSHVMNSRQASRVNPRCP